MSKQNHHYLYDSLSKERKNLIDINNLDVYGNSALQIAIENKNVPMIERILREFRDKLKFVDSGEESIVNMNLSKKHIPLLHPLVLSVKKQMIEYAIRILKIIENQHSRQIYFGQFNFNLTDDDNNTLFHFIFQNFSLNTDLNVELCQKLLNISERCQENVLNINSLNKFGQSPLDIAIENKQNQALEFAIYYNKNQLPGCQTNVKNQKFNLNNSLNQRQITPLHRAIVAQNYRAIYLLLTSNECNIMQKDKDFRSAKDYCQRALFLFKYLKKGEMNYIRSIFEKNKVFSEFTIHPIRRKQNQQQQFTSHNHISHYYSGLTNRRVKYNSQYNKRNKKILSTSQQVDIVKNDLYLHDTQPLMMDDYVILDSFQEEEGIMIEGSKSRQINITSNLKTTKDNGALNTRQLSSPMSNLKIKSAQSCQKPKLNSELLQPRQPHSSNDVTAHLHQKDKPNFKVINRNSDYAMIKRDSLCKKRKISQVPIATIDSIDQNTENDKAHKMNIQNNRGVTIEQEGEDLYSDLDLSLDGDNDLTLMPSMRFHYVLNPNSSALSRKTYYKQLQKNTFESEYSAIIDINTPMSTKIENLYKIYTTLQSTMDQQKLKDGTEIFAFLRLELENKDESVMFLKNEIMYFQENLQPTNRDSSKNVNSRNMKSLEKGPLPCIRENDVEDLFGKSPSKNLKSQGNQHQRTPNKNQLHYYKRLQVNTVKLNQKEDLPRPNQQNKHSTDQNEMKNNILQNNLSVTVDQGQISPKNLISQVPSNLIEPTTSKANSPIHPNFSLMQVSMSSRANNNSYYTKESIVKTVGVSLIEKRVNNSDSKQAAINHQLVKNLGSKNGTPSNYESTPLASGTHQMPLSNFFCKTLVTVEPSKRCGSNLKQNKANCSSQMNSGHLDKSQVSNNVPVKNQPQGSEIKVGASRCIERKTYKTTQNESTLRQILHSSMKSDTSIKYRQPISCKSSISSNHSKNISKRQSMKK